MLQKIININITDIIGILIIYQSFIFFLSLLFNKNTKPLFLRVLISYFILIMLHFGYMLFEKYSHSNLFLGPFFGFTYGPIFYTYTKSLILEDSNYKKIGFHFIPAVLALIALILFDDQIMGLIDVLGLIVSFHYITYLGISLKFLFKYRKLLKNTTSLFYSISLFWLEYLIYLQFFIIAVMLLEGYFQRSFIVDVYILIIYILVLILTYCFYYLGLKQVRLFKGFKLENTKTSSPKEYEISQELFNKYIATLVDYIESDEPYLQYDISLQDLSDKLSISPRNLSHVINKKFQRNFYEFINHYRLKLVKINLQSSEKSIKEIMYDCGFSNKATFNSLFKKNTGMTPTQFRENLKNGS